MSITKPVQLSQIEQRDFSRKLMKEVRKEIRVQSREDAKAFYEPENSLERLFRTEPLIAEPKRIANWIRKVLGKRPYFPIVLRSSQL